jgi:nicotinamidase/pyrazinamidase
MAQVLLVVDMLKGFCEEGRPLYCGPGVKAVIPFIRKLIEGANERGETVIFISDSHDPQDLEFQRFPPHCIAGSEEAEVIDELRGLARSEIVIPKKRYSGFFGTNLEQVLAGLRPELVEVVGVCTNICVLYTVEELRNRDYPVRVYRRGVTSFDAGAHLFALQQMETVLGAEVK